MSIILYGQGVTGEKSPTGGKEYTYKLTSKYEGLPTSHKISVSGGKLTSANTAGLIVILQGSKSIEFKVRWNNETGTGKISTATTDFVRPESYSYSVNITRDGSTPPDPICTPLNINGQNITSNKNYTACAVEIINTSISNNATVEIRGRNYVSIQPPFKAKAGSTVYINKSNTLEPGPVLRSTNVDLEEEINNLNPILQQNIPNPFSGSTKISYAIPENSRNAFLQIVDMNGRMIDKIEINERGNGYITLYGDKLQSNVIYLYSLIIDGKIIDTKRFYMK